MQKHRRPWTATEDTAIRLAVAVSRQRGIPASFKLREIAARIGRTYAATTSRASTLKRHATNSAQASISAQRFSNRSERA